MQADSAATRPAWAESVMRIAVMVGALSASELILNDYGWRVYPALWLAFGAGAFWHSRWPA